MKIKMFPITCSVLCPVFSSFHSVLLFGCTISAEYERGGGGDGCSCARLLSVCVGVCATESSNVLVQKIGLSIIGKSFRSLDLEF